MAQSGSRPCIAHILHLSASVQVLVYKQEKLQARLQYLHSIGLSRAQLIAIATCNPQILSLDIADNLAPKVCWVLGQGWSVRCL